MRAIIIGAGRGSRLMPTTANAPKCFAEVSGKRMLDWAVSALRSAGVDEFVFIGGYQIDIVRKEYPEFQICENKDWPNNNILLSLFHAEKYFDEGFVCCYSDVLFSERIVQDIMKSQEDITLAVDTEWLTRYLDRTEHPSDDAEKVTVENGTITRVDRQIPEQDAYGEFIGLARFSPTGAQMLREDFEQRRKTHAGRPYRDSRSFEKAYLIHLLQDMIESGRRMTHVDTPGGYIEVDTQQDFEYARRTWMDSHAHL